MWWAQAFLPASFCKGGFSCFDVLQDLGFLFVVFFSSVIILKKEKLLPPPYKNKPDLKTSWGMRNCTTCFGQLSLGRTENNIGGKEKIYSFSVDSVESIIGYWWPSNLISIEGKSEIQQKEGR